MHSAIENKALTGGLQVIGVGADLGPAREIDELHKREDGRGRLTRAIAKLSW
jgi:hypothetical protein